MSKLVFINLFRFSEFFLISPELRVKVVFQEIWFFFLNSLSRGMFRPPRGTNFCQLACSGEKKRNERIWFTKIPNQRPSWIALKWKTVAHSSLSGGFVLPTKCCCSTQKVEWVLWKPPLFWEGARPVQPHRTDGQAFVRNLGLFFGTSASVTRWPSSELGGEMWWTVEQLTLKLNNYLFAFDKGIFIMDILKKYFV